MGSTEEEGEGFAERWSGGVGSAAESATTGDGAESGLGIGGRGQMFSGEKARGGFRKNASAQLFTGRRE
jgi:hypothetical protein